METERPVAFPYDSAEVAIQKLFPDTSVFGNMFSSIDSGSIEFIDNEILRQEMPDVDFYFMIYYKGQYWEYNGGKIPTVFANPKQKNIRPAVLIPFDYNDGQEDFCKLFCNRPFGNKRDEVCIAICDLFMRTYTIHSINCDKSLKELTHDVLKSVDTMRITTKWKEACWPVPDDRKDERLWEHSRTGIFIFRGDTLKSTNLSGWFCGRQKVL